MKLPSWRRTAGEMSDSRFSRRFRRRQFDTRIDSIGVTDTKQLVPSEPVVRAFFALRVAQIWHVTRIVRG